MTSREAFLQRVRQAVSAGNKVGTAAPLPPRGPIGYQGAGTDAVQRFCTELATAGGQSQICQQPEQVLSHLFSIIAAKNARKILLSRDRIVLDLDLANVLRDRGLEVIQVDLATPANWRESFFQADLGISGVAHLVAETGTVVMATAPHQPRAVSLLPPVHIALARREQLLPDLFDLFDLFSPVGAPGKATVPSCLTLITGPSKTGDIELRLVTGVHGPGELHVVVALW